MGFVTFLFLLFFCLFGRIKQNATFSGFPSGRYRNKWTVLNMPKFYYAMKIETVWKSRLLTKISIFDQNFDFWPKFRFLTKISIFDQNFDFREKFRLLRKISILDNNLDVCQTKISNFWPKFPIFDQNFHFNQYFDMGQNFDISKKTSIFEKLRFLREISILREIFMNNCLTKIIKLRAQFHCKFRFCAKLLG